MPHPTITTTSINNRTDWYHAQATYKDKQYFTFQVDRTSAFMEVLRQLIVAGAYPNLTLTV